MKHAEPTEGRGGRLSGRPPGCKGRPAAAGRAAAGILALLLGVGVAGTPPAAAGAPGAGGQAAGAGAGPAAGLAPPAGSLTVREALDSLGYVELRVPARLVAGQPLNVTVVSLPAPGQEAGPPLRSAVVYLSGDGGASYVAFPIRPPAQAPGAAMPAGTRLSLAIPFRSLPRTQESLLVYADVTDERGARVRVPAAGPGGPVRIRMQADRTPPTFQLVGAPSRFAVGERVTLAIRPIDDSGGIDTASVRVELDGRPLSGVMAVSDLIAVSVRLQEVGPHRLVVQARDPAGNSGRQEFVLQAYRPLKVNWGGEFVTRASADHRVREPAVPGETASRFTSRLGARLEVGPLAMRASVETRQGLTSQLSGASASSVNLYALSALLKLLDGRLVLEGAAGQYTPRLTDLTLSGRSVEEGWKLRLRLWFTEAEAFFGRLSSSTEDSYARHVMGLQWAPVLLEERLWLRLGAAWISDAFVDLQGQPQLREADGGVVGARQNLVASLQLGTRLWGLRSETEVAASAAVSDITEVVPYTEGGELIEGSGLRLSPSVLYSRIPGVDPRWLYSLFPVPRLSPGNLLPLPVGTALRWSLAADLRSSGETEFRYLLADSGFRPLAASAPTGKEILSLSARARLGQRFRLQFSAADEREVTENVILVLARDAIYQALGLSSDADGGAGAGSAGSPRARRLTFKAGLDGQLGSVTLSPFVTWSLSGQSTRAGLVPALLTGQPVAALEGVPIPQRQQLEAGAALRRVPVGGASVDLRGAWMREVAYEAPDGGGAGGAAVQGVDQGYAGEIGVSFGPNSVRLGAERRPDAASPDQATMTYSARLSRSFGWWSLGGAYSRTQKPQQAGSEPAERFEVQGAASLPLLGGSVGISLSAGGTRSGGQFQPAVSAQAQYALRW